MLNSDVYVTARLLNESIWFLSHGNQWLKTFTQKQYPQVDHRWPIQGLLVAFSLQGKLRLHSMRLIPGSRLLPTPAPSHPRSNMSQLSRDSLPTHGLGSYCAFYAHALTCTPTPQMIASFIDSVYCPQEDSTPPGLGHRLPLGPL